MTKEEYEKLLQSDYWKGFSYSLIKERNFTCEDCGRRFFNQRNKLQVHHLFYRDINPWSYKPEEMVVLCEECHKKRHGISTEPIREGYNSHNQGVFGDYTKTYSYSTESREERPHFYSEADRWGNSNDRTGANGTDTRNPYPIESQGRFKWKYALYGILILFALSFAWNRINQIQSNNSKEKEEISPKSVADESGHFEPSIEEEDKVQEQSSKLYNRNKTKNEEPNSDLVNKRSVTKTEFEESTVPTVTPSTEAPHNDIVPSKENVSPQRELSTIELLERRNHEEVVRQARRAGVSTEGSTTDILERINHAEVVKQAKRAGVSTEGSTTDILERINHAEVVKQAKRLGVSTEGSTTDILERINRKEIEKMNW